MWWFTISKAADRSSTDDLEFTLASLRVSTIVRSVVSGVSTFEARLVVIVL